MLAKQLKSINMFDETQSAVWFELTIQKLDVQRRLKDLNAKIEVVEKKIKQGENVDKAKEFDPIRVSLFELKREQQESVVQEGLKLMYKLGTLVQDERAHLRELYAESTDHTSKLNRFTQELQRRR